MAIDLQELTQAVARHGRVARVVIAAVAGSSPREVGTAMLVWQDGQSGTIGGGTLEYEAAKAARRALQQCDGPVARLSHHALGPDLGQCCGGRVSLWTEVIDAAQLAEFAREQVIARPTDGSALPLAVQRLRDSARSSGRLPQTQLVQGWLVEPVHQPDTAVWIWGAGHVGRALVDVLAPLPDLALTWVDTSPDRFPDEVPTGVTVLPAKTPEALMPHAPETAHHLILTYSHAMDLALCHAALTHRFASAGVIGSATKWARFRKRLGQLGHAPDRIDQITCPIGDPALGKHPQAIAVSVAGALLTAKAAHTAQRKEHRA